MFLSVPRDAQLLLVSVFIRRASFGLTNQVLALFLEAVGISKPRMGAFMALTLAGDTAVSLFLTWFSDALGRRRVMVLGCVLMLAAGLVFAYCLGFWVLLGAAIVGVISTLGDETGPFKTVEEACLAHLTSRGLRPQAFAAYGFLGTAGAAVGAQVAGALVQYWSAGRPLEECYRAVFLVYAGLAVAKLLLALGLSEQCELDGDDGETEPLAPAQDSSLSPALKAHLLRLVPVFMLDSFGYGFMPPAWIVYYFQRTYAALPAELGTLFFLTSLVDLFSAVASAYTFSLLGPVKAILAAQMPSAVFFGAVPMAPSYFLAATLYFLFCACATMDVVPRQILLTTLIEKRDLIRVLGIVNVAKTLARCVGPLFTGVLAEANRLSVAFYVNAVCLFAADSILGWSFVHLDLEILAQA